MDPKHLEENFAALVKDVFTQKPKREGHFISRCLIWSPPSREKLKVDHEMFLVDQATKTTKSADDEDNVEAERIAL